MAHLPHTLHLSKKYSTQCPWIKCAPLHPWIKKNVPYCALNIMYPILCFWIKYAVHSAPEKNITCRVPLNKICPAECSRIKYDPHWAPEWNVSYRVTLDKNICPIMWPLIKNLPFTMQMCPTMCQKISPPHSLLVRNAPLPMCPCRHSAAARGGRPGLFWWALNLCIGLENAAWCKYI